MQRGAEGQKKSSAADARVVSTIKHWFSSSFRGRSSSQEKAREGWPF